jgi:hypothetical protein
MKTSTVVAISVGTAVAGFLGMKLDSKAILEDLYPSDMVLTIVL